MEVLTFMTFRQACDEVLAKGCTTLWPQHLWETNNPRLILDKWVDAQDRMQQKRRPGKWVIRDERYLWFVPDDTPTTAVKVYYAA